MYYDGLRKTISIKNKIEMAALLEVLPLLNEIWKTEEHTAPFSTPPFYILQFYKKMIKQILQTRSLKVSILIRPMAANVFLSNGIPKILLAFTLGAGCFE